jgi:hypothetical protein
MVSRFTSSEFPGFEHIYYVRAQRPGVFIGRLLQHGDQAEALLRGEVVPDAPAEIEWFRGRKRPQDVVAITKVGPLIIAERIRSLLADRSFTGWSTYPVVVIGQHGECFAGYHGLTITGRCGPILRDRSLSVVKRYPAGMFPAYRGWFFEPSSWDGSDIFMPSDPTFATIFVVDAVRQALIDARVKAIDLERADLVEYSDA